MALKLLIVTERFYPEEFIINDLASAWVERGFDVEVLTQAPSYPFGKIFQGYKNHLYSEELWKTIRIRRFFTVTGYRDSLFFKLLNYVSFVLAGGLIALFIAKRYDRIFVYQTGPLTLAVPAVLGGIMYGKPVTIWTQDVWPDTVYAYGFRKTRLLSWFLDRFVGFIYKNCARIFVSCEGFVGKLAPYAPGKTISHFPNWPTVTPALCPQGGQSAGLKLSDKFNFTFAGNIGKVQNLENVMRGFGRASSRNNDIQLNIVGDGSHLETLKEIARKENIRNVVFWGRKKQHEMPAFFSASDVMVISLNDEPVFNITVPAKFQAYLAFSKPILAVMNGEVRALVERHGTGLCADPGDLNVIGARFLEFYSLRGGGLEKFAANSRTLLETVYDRKKILDGMTALLAGTGSGTRGAE
jgi:glycosyltransferase involved in cell wall biosynthesis